MYTANREIRGRAIRRIQWLTADRIIPYSCIMLMLFTALLILGIVTDGFTSTTTVRPGTDFSVFWTASHLVLHGHAASVYDISSFKQAEFAHFGASCSTSRFPGSIRRRCCCSSRRLPLRLSFLPAYFPLLAGSLLCYAFAVSRLSGLRAHLPHRAPPRSSWSRIQGCLSALFGQNDRLPASPRSPALHLLGARSAGVVIGLLAIKPQLAVVFSVRADRGAGMAHRAAAALSATLFAAAGLPTALHGLKAMSTVRDMHFMLASYWFASPTPFAALRLAGAPVRRRWRKQRRSH